MKDKFNVVLYVIFFLSVVSFGSWVGYRIYRLTVINVGSGCDDHLKKALKAPSIEIALKEMKKAITFLEKNNLTTGNTEYYLQEKSKWDDIGSWYRGLKVFYEKTKQENPKQFCAECEKKEHFLVFRKDLKSLFVPGNISPRGISVYPYNAEIALWGAISVFLLLISVGWLSYRKSKSF